MTNDEIWNDERPVSAHGIHVPEWIDQDISAQTIAAIQQGGCASGSYMPAVTYHTAAQIMAEHGDDVLEYIESVTGELPTPPRDSSGGGIAVFFLSYAVELWAFDALEILENQEVA